MVGPSEHLFQTAYSAQTHEIPNVCILHQQPVFKHNGCNIAQTGNRLSRTRVHTFSCFTIQDKQRARKQDRRIPEAKLHLLNLLGGWPGGYCGSLAFRHKTSKPEFVRTFRLSAATNTVATLLLLADTLKHSNQ